MSIIIGFSIALFLLLTIVVVLLELMIIRELRAIASQLDLNIKSTNLLGTEWIKFTVGVHQAIKATEKQKQEWNERLT